MKFTVDPLPFAQDALEPHISARTVDIHYNKHHKGYMTKLDKALGKDARRDKTLEDIIRSSDGHVFNCAAQVWNHTFYWSSLVPKNTAKQPEGSLRKQIEKDFGTLDSLEEELKSVAAGEFGSGWGWLVFNDQKDKLQVISTTDAETPITEGLLPLLTLDVWEHAYYLDYQNERGKYLDAIIGNLINWEFAEKNFAARNN
jgi:Fe-Mn family superoxide dismutase